HNGWQLDALRVEISLTYVALPGQCAGDCMARIRGEVLDSRRGPRPGFCWCIRARCFLRLVPRTHDALSSDEALFPSCRQGNCRGDLGQSGVLPGRTTAPGSEADGHCPLHRL